MALSVPAVLPGSLTLYLNSIGKEQILSAEEERALSINLRDKGCLASAQKLILSHLRFVVFIAKRYTGYGLPQEDLIQEGNVGLMKAVKGFDPDRGVRLSTFAVHWIKAEIHGYILRNWRIVKIATTKAQRKLFFNLRRLQGTKDALAPEDVAMIANTLDVPEYEVLGMESRLRNSDVSFEPLTDNPDGQGTSPSFYLDDKTSRVEDNVAEAQYSEIMSSKMHKALDQLDDRSRDIVHSRWLCEECKPTLTDLANKYGISAERVRQLEAQAFKKMKGLIV